MGAQGSKGSKGSEDGGGALSDAEGGLPASMEWTLYLPSEPARKAQPIPGRTRVVQGRQARWRLAPSEPLRPYISYPFML